MAISMLKIRRPLGRLIFNMGIAIPGKTVFLIETAPSSGPLKSIEILKTRIEITTWISTSVLTHPCLSFNDGWVKPLSKLTLNVRGPSYLGLTRSISWLLMPWLLTSPGHQQPWYWLCRIGGFLSYLRKDLNYLRRTNVEKWHKM